MTLTEQIDITELRIAAVLAALCNHTKPLGYGRMNDKAFNVITEEECQELLGKYEETPSDRLSIKVGYIFGRPIKTLFSKDKEGRLFLDDTRLYDRDSSKTVAEVIKELQS